MLYVCNEEHFKCVREWKCLMCDSVGMFAYNSNHVHYVLTYEYICSLSLAIYPPSLLGFHQSHSLGIQHMWSQLATSISLQSLTQCVSQMEGMRSSDEEISVEFQTSELNQVPMATSSYSLQVLAHACTESQ